jgi:uncharacterized membrane protein
LIGHQAGPRLPELHQVDLQTLRQRLAAGEIRQEDFERTKKVLEG